MFDKLFRRQAKSAPAPVGADADADAVDAAEFDIPDTLVEVRETEEMAEYGNGAGEAPLAEATALNFTYICREPVVDRTQRVIGYEFMLRESSAPLDLLVDPIARHHDEQALLTRLASMDLARLLAYRYTFLCLSAQVLLRPMIEQLPPDLTVLLVRADTFGAAIDPNLAARMAHLRRMGFGFGLMVNSSSMRYIDQLHHLTHYVVIDLTESNPGELLKAVVQGMQRWPETQVLVRHIPDVQTFELCSKTLLKYVGIHLFQGDFLTQPLPWRSDHVDTGKARIVKLLNSIKRKYDIPVLAESLRHDPLLLSRLLRYANSAAQQSTLESQQRRACADYHGA